MKRFLVLLLTFLMLFSLVACGDKKTDAEIEESQTKEQSSIAETVEKEFGDFSFDIPEEDYSDFFDDASFNESETTTSDLEDSE